MAHLHCFNTILSKIVLKNRFSQRLTTCELCVSFTRMKTRSEISEIEVRNMKFIDDSGPQEARIKAKREQKNNALLSYSSNPDGRS